MAETKEKLAELELKKAADLKRKEKEEDKAAKERIKALLEQDKRERAERAAANKAGSVASAPTPAVSLASAASSGITKEYAETRLQVMKCVLLK